MVPILEETRKSIQEKVASKMGTDQTIFDTAQQEVTHPDFWQFKGSLSMSLVLVGGRENDKDDLQEFPGQ